MVHIGKVHIQRSHKYIERFGDGFMRLSMKHNAPIIPVGIVGMEETIRSYADIKPLAKLLGMPVAPLVIPFIFPSKVYICFGKPMHFSEDVHKDSEVKERVEKVKTAIDDLLKIGLQKRKEYLKHQKDKKNN